MVQAVTLAFCSIQWHFIRDICTKFDIPNLPQSLDIAQNSDEGISDFLISGQSFIKQNCHNSRTSDAIGIKLEPVSRRHKRNKTTSKNLTITSCREIVTSSSFFGIIANFDQTGS